MSYSLDLVVFGVIIFNNNIIVLPRNEPRISGGKKHYYIDDHVRVNCTSARSKPAAVLHWFVNNKPVI